MASLIIASPAGGRHRGSPSMPPPEDGAPPKAPKPPGEDGAGKKVSVADAHKVSADEHCSNCEHYQGESGECEKVEGVWQPDDACVKYFEPMGGEEGSDSEEAGESPEYEASEDEPRE